MHVHVYMYTHTHTNASLVNKPVQWRDRTRWEREECSLMLLLNVVRFSLAFAQYLSTSSKLLTCSAHTPSTPK